MSQEDILKTIEKCCKEEGVKFRLTVTDLFSNIGVPYSYKTRKAVSNLRRKYKKRGKYPNGKRWGVVCW